MVEFGIEVCAVGFVSALCLPLVGFILVFAISSTVGVGVALFYGVGLSQVFVEFVLSTIFAQVGYGIGIIARFLISRIFKTSPVIKVVSPKPVETHIFRKFKSTNQK